LNRYLCAHEFSAFLPTISEPASRCDLLIQVNYTLLPLSRTDQLVLHLDDSVCPGRRQKSLRWLLAASAILATINNVLSIDHAALSKNIWQVEPGAFTLRDFYLICMESTPPKRASTLFDRYLRITVSLLVQAPLPEHLQFFELVCPHS
jgi:hypothetical protein